MAVTTQWHDANKTIILCHYKPDWTIPEHYETVERTKTMMDAVGHDRVDIIVWLTGNVRQLMVNSEPGYNILHDAHPSLGVIVLVTENRIMASVASVTMRLNALTRRYYRAANSIEQAERVIADERRDSAAGRLQSR